MVISENEEAVYPSQISTTMAVSDGRGLVKSDSLIPF